MSRLHDIVSRVNDEIKRRNLDFVKTRGVIALKAGFVLGFINTDTQDDPEKVERLRKAVKEVLGISV